MVRKRKTAKEEIIHENSNGFEDENSTPKDLDDVDELLSDMDADVVIDEPDEMLLAQEAREIARQSE
jgi:hypothetical protein